jgi:hypothetical protein
MSDLIKLVSDLANSFDRLGLRYAVGGALATNYWGIVRTTVDVDCLIAIPALKYQDFADALQSLGCRLRDPAGKPIDISAEQMRQSALERNLIECFRDSIQIELFLPIVPLQNEILRRAVDLSIGNRKISVTTAEDIILLKMVFHRVKDLQDVRGVLWVQRGKLDLDYLRHWSSRTLADEAQQELEELISESIAAES